MAGRLGRATEPDWRKVKHQRMQEVVIAGWRSGKGRRANRIRSLILAVPNHNGDLQHVGGVGTGFTERMLEHLATVLAPLRQDASPFPTPLPRADTRDAIWVHPELLGEVPYTEWTGDGHLRHPPGAAYDRRCEQERPPRGRRPKALTRRPAPVVGLLGTDALAMSVTVACAMLAGGCVLALIVGPGPRGTRRGGRDGRDGEMATKVRTAT